MRKAIILLILILFLFACSKGAEVEKKIEYSKGEGYEVPVEEEVEESEEETDEVESEETDDEETEEVEDLPTQTPPEGIETGTCTQDSKGVVRVYHDDGKKTVYRHDCNIGLLIKYGCEDGKITEKIIPCSSGKCLQGPYGDQCAP